MKKIDIRKFGKYSEGLTIEETKKYIMKRAKVKKIGTLWEQFCDIAGVNTCPIITDENGDEVFGMYRCDVLRFTDALLLKTPTYFD